ncbi:MAG: metallophosphoesterase [Chlorobi bacterium]|nr:metallophosphoesterase [Chlorobiota bacterium]
MRIGLITDIHFSMTGDTGSAPAAVADLRACLAAFRENRTHFMLQLGDLIAGSAEDAESELMKVLPILGEYTGGACRHVIGNHCLAVPRERLLASLGLQRAYYSFVFETFRFVVLDGMDVSVSGLAGTEADRQLLKRSLAQAELHDYCGAIGERQMAWLRTELSEADERSEQVIVICHFPLHPATSDMKHGLLWNHMETRRVLAECPAVKACIGGHYHYGGSMEEDGIHYIVLKAFVNREEHPGSAWTVAELRQERLIVTARNGQALFDLELSRTGNA